MYDLHNISADQDCLEENNISDYWKCLFPENAISYITTPLFIVQSLEDYYQLGQFTEIPYCLEMESEIFAQPSKCLDLSILLRLSLLV